MTLEELADAAAINVTYLSDIERGHGRGANPSIGKLGALAAVFGIRVSELVAAAEDASH